MSKIETELNKAFKNSGFGDVEVKIDKVGVSAGYGVETEMSFLIRITKSNQSAVVKAVRRAIRRPRKTYKIERRSRGK